MAIKPASRRVDLWCRVVGLLPVLVLIFVGISVATECVEYGNVPGPDFVGWYDTSGDARSGVVQDNIAYVADKYSGLQVIDIADPTQPARLGGRTASAYAYGVDVEGGYAYIAAYISTYVNFSFLNVFDVTDPTDPQLVGSVATSKAEAVAVEGAHAYLADGSAGLRVVDVANPAQPQIIATMDLGGYASDVAIEGTLVYVVINTGLSVVDVTDPANPQLVGNLVTPGSARRVAVVGDRAYVAVGEAGLVVVDIADPLTLQILGQVTTPEDAIGVAAAGAYAYVAAGDAGVQVVNVADPQNPLIVGSLPTRGDDCDVFVADTAVVVADGLQGITLIPPQCEVAVAVDDRPADPTVGLIAFPNPGAGETSLRFQTTRSGMATMAIYDLAGRRVRELAREVVDAGGHSVRWDGRDDTGHDVPAGIYLARVTTGEGPATVRIVLAR